MTSLATKDVLIVDDEEPIRGMLSAVLARIGVTCDTAVDGAEALDYVAATQYAVVLVDLMMPRLDGEAFAVALGERQAPPAERPVVLMMTAFPAQERAAEIGGNVQAIIQKPFDIVEVAELVHACVEAWRFHESAAAVDVAARSEEN